MSIGTIVLIVLILLLLGVFPTWPHSRSWGYAPSGGIGLIVANRAFPLARGCGAARARSDPATAARPR